MVTAATAAMSLRYLPSSSWSPAEMASSNAVWLMAMTLGAESSTTASMCSAIHHGRSHQGVKNASRKPGAA